MAKDKKRAQEVENKRTNVDMAKHLEKLKTELVTSLEIHIFLFPFIAILL